MCGIVMLFGPSAVSRLPSCLNRLRHRGPDDQVTWSSGGLALGFARLAINGDGMHGRQPYEHGDQMGAINGEIYNYRSLAAEHGIGPTSCDTNVVLPLLERFGPRVIDHLDGFYAGVVVRRSSHEVFCLRDHMGKKPLFVGRSASEVFIASELKVFHRVEWFKPLPRGVSKVDLRSGEVVQLAEHQAPESEEGLGALFQAAVLKRLPEANQPVGVFLSGGLDSSLVAAFVARERPDATYFTLGDANSPDWRAVDAVTAALALRDVRPVSLPSRERFPSLLQEIVHATESFNPSIVSNGLATYLLAEAAHDAGIKVVLTGEGADELFGGYHMFGPDDPWRAVRDRLVDDMHQTELRRLDLSSMAHSVEARCPFLDRAVRAFSDRLTFNQLYDRDENKVSLRRTFEGLLPRDVLHRRKTSFDVGSGLRGELVHYLRRDGRTERDELRDVWRRSFSFDESEPYFHAYPVFEAAIDARGATHR
jgi:asparagine synthase (glutamine-hydrolysing)